MKLPIIILSIATASSTAFADDEAPSSNAPTDPVNSINASPLGVAFGNYALTYERLLGGQHGLVVEGIVTRSSGDDGDSTQFGGAAGYRWHWRGRQNSGFLGIMFAQGFGSGEVSVNGMSHDMTVRSTTITGNVGKRWLFGPINVTVRAGLGYGHYTAKAKEDTQEAKDAEKLMNDILAFLPIAIDGELSVGYTF